MQVRSPTLEEWFLQYQMASLRGRHFHFPVDLDLNITALVEKYRVDGRKPPYTAILIKAVAEATKRHPEVNRAVFRTFYGTKIVEFDEVNVNLPIIYQHQGKEHVGAMVLKAANAMTIGEICDAIRDEISKPLSSRPVGRQVVGRANNFLNRWKLRCIHFFVYNFPHFYLKFGGGGVSVSSLLNYAEDGFVCRPVSFGHTALTFCCSDVRIENGQHILRVGVGYDHFAGGGHTAIAAFRTLARITASGDL